MSALEPLIRQYCAKALDPLVEGGRFDFVADLGAQMPMRVIGMLLGIPEEDQQAVRRRADSALITETGKPMDFSEHSFVGEGFEEYLDWRVQHPSNDLMTELVNAEFADETGTTRKLSRDEVLIFVNIIASAGNETTNRLIGWTGKVLAEHPDQLRQIYEDRELIAQTIEEVLRYEPPPPHIARYVARDTEFYGTTVPAGSAILFLVGAANRDERKFANGERFDIHRARLPHLTFGNGSHSCIGNALARVEGRVALDELLNRFPEWNVDLERAQLSCTSTVRGWETLPAYTLRASDTSKASPADALTTSADAVRLAGAEVWKMTLKTPMGPQEMTAQIVRQGDGFTGRIDSPMGSETMKNGKIVADTLTWTMEATKPMKIKLSFEVKIEGDKMTGKAKLGLFGSASLTGQRI
jgi:cytochrome P450